jgi:tetratricopeptide (TPR) repeat protein
MNFDSGFEQSEDFNSWDQAEQKAVKAYELYEEGRMNEALSAMNEAIDINPSNDRWHFNKALTLDAMERFEPAIDEYKLALDLSPEDIETLNCLAVDYTRTGQYDLALEIFGQIEKIDPEFEPGYCNRIITYTEMGDYEMAEHMFYLAQQINENCPLCFYNIGNSFFIQDDFKKAIWCWEKTANFEPNHPQINYHIARGYWNLGEKEMAWRYFIEELKKNPGDKEVVFDFGLFLLGCGDTVSAAEKFRRILEIEPDCAAAVFYLGEIELSAGRKKEAAKLYLEALKIDKNTIGPRFRIAQMAFERKEKDEAFSLLRAELELDMAQPEILQAIGIMMMEMGQTDYATHCFLRVSELEPTKALNYLYLAKVLAMRGEKDDAEQFLDYAIEIEPANYEIVKGAMLVFLDMQMPQKVLDVLEALKAEPSFGLRVIRTVANLKLWSQRLRENVRHRLRIFGK